MFFVIGLAVKVICSAEHTVPVLYSYC